MSKSEIKRIEISIRAEIEAELREQIAKEIEDLLGMNIDVRDDWSHVPNGVLLYRAHILQAIRGK